MTDEEYREEELDIFATYKVPEELRSSLSYYAYEKGHSAGRYECALVLRELCSTLAPGLEKLTNKQTNKQTK